MKKFRKALPLLLVVVIAITAMLCGTVTAGAADSKRSLLTLDITEIDSNATNISHFGQDLCLVTGENNYTAVYRIDSEAIKNWRSTGNLNATRIEVDETFSKYDWSFVLPKGFLKGDYTVVGFTRNDKIYYCGVKYEKEKNRIKAYATLDKINGISDNGTLCQFDYNSDKNRLKINLINTSGKKFKTLSYSFGSKSATWYGFNIGNNIYITSYEKNENDEFVGETVLINEKGKEFKKWDVASNFQYIGSNYFSFAPFPAASLTNVYNFDTKKEYNLWGMDLSNVKSGGNEYLLSAELGYTICGTKAIGSYYRYDESGNSYDKYAVIDISTGKILSGVYDYIETYDNGKTYLVMDSKGRWGYLNKNGKKLGMFIDASVFLDNGKYALVNNSGKIYLIDKKMNQISKAIKADKDATTYTLCDELFSYTYNGKTYIVTNK